ncbi:amidase domain-containing protein [Streptomyces sp. bgisy100]|uniref:amidase domain-containing protein n=1 Tax=Streptomyces sp. bgisy100 TaxID=3413783 RepID=UPI003D73C244
MKPPTTRSTIGAVLTGCLSAALLPASAAHAAEVRTADSTTVKSFARIADAVLTERTETLVNARPAKHMAPRHSGTVRLSKRLARAEDTALSSLETRKDRLASLGEAYTDADTRVRVGSTRVRGGKATVRVTETTTLTYQKIRGDEPATTGFQAHHELSLTAGPDGTWQLTGIRPTDEGPRPVNAPAGKAAAASAASGPNATPAATSWPAPSRPKTGGAYNYAAMATYAEKYWSNYNPAYRKFNDVGGDCTNFISQALKAGGWKNDSGLYSDYRNWWYDSSNQTMSWVGADDWSWFTLSSRRATNLSNVYQLGVGDILQMDFDRDGSKDHSMITTYRSRSGVPYLTYHSTNTYRKSVASIVASYPRSLYYAYRT